MTTGESAVPLNRPALTLSPGPRGVQDARRWVVEVFRDIGREDLSESAELGVSELVTNAVLHGSEPVGVRVRGTTEHPRVEVSDASLESPVLPGPLALDRDDDLLLTFGRGLAIVARVSDAWGAEIEADGKVVWFAPSVDISEEGVEGVVRGSSTDEVSEEVVEAVDVVVLQMPVPLYMNFRNHFRELSREVRLLSLSHGDDYPLAAHLSGLFNDLLRQLRRGLVQTQLSGAMSAGSDVADLRVRVPRSAVITVTQLIELLDLADEFCRQERLLALARTPEQRSFQRWLLGEYVRQADGQEPTPWVPEADRQVG